MLGPRSLVLDARPMLYLFPLIAGLDVFAAHMFRFISHLSSPTRIRLPRSPERNFLILREALSTSERCRERQKGRAEQEIFVVAMVKGGGGG